MERRNDVTKERIVKELSKVRKQLADLQERQKEKFIEKNKISLEHLILLNKVSEEEILSLLRKKEQEEQMQQEQQTEREAESHEQKNEVTL